MKPFLTIATEIGALVEEKNAAYGSSFADAGKFLALLYPEGLRVDQYDDALLLVRIFDKQKRIATDRDALGESPYRDIAGYGVLGAALVEQKRKEATECGAVSAWDAANQRPNGNSSAPANAIASSPQKSSPKSGPRSAPEPSDARTAASSSQKRKSQHARSQQPGQSARERA